MDQRTFLPGFAVPTAQGLECVRNLSSDGHGRGTAISTAGSRLCDMVAILAIVFGIGAVWFEDQPRWRLFPLCRRHVVTVSGGAELERQSHTAIFV